MDYAGILKRAWMFTWRHKAMWVLGLFAGVTGPGGGGSGLGGGGGSGLDGGGEGGFARWADSPSALMEHITAFLPVIIAVGLALAIVVVVWWILSIAARAGLVAAVDGAESGASLGVGGAWSEGFAKWGRVFLLDLVLGLPLLVMGLFAFILFLFPIARLLLADGGMGPEALPGLCGGVIVLLLMLPLGVVLGVLQIVGLRYAVLEDMPAMRAIGAAWGALRHRFKDTALMYLLSWAVNVGVAIALTLLLIVPALAVTVMAAGVAVAGETAAFVGIVVVAGAVFGVIIFAFSAAWGTFTSALWTIWWRRLTGREALASTVVIPQAPAPPASPAPPSSPAPVEEPVAIYPLAASEPPDLPAGEGADEGAPPGRVDV